MSSESLEHALIRPVAAFAAGLVVAVSLRAGVDFGGDANGGGERCGCALFLPPGNLSAERRVIRRVLSLREMHARQGVVPVGADSRGGCVLSLCHE